MNTTTQTEERREDGAVRCADIQSALVAYLTRELGEPRNGLVREHLQHCADCQRAAADMKRTIEALRGGVPALGDALLLRLSDERRKRMRWSVSHPVLDWIYWHHVGVSLVTAVVLLMAIWLFLATYKPEWVRWSRIGPEVTIGQGAPPEMEEPAP